MNVFQSLKNDRVTLVKKDGQRFENLSASVQTGLILTDNPEIPIEDGDQFERQLPLCINTRQHRVRDIRLSLGRGGGQGLPCVKNVQDELLDIALVDERREDEAFQANHRLPVVGLPVAVGHGDADAFAAHRPLV